MRALAIAALLTAICTPSHACVSFEGEVYDDLSSEHFSVAIAEVTDLTITNSSDSESCFAVDYRRQEMLRGDLPDSFRVESCDDGGPMTLDDFEWSADEIGFVSGATVLVGVMPSERGTVGLRLAVPNCWGPLHLRLDLMDKTEREVLIVDVKDMLAAAAEKP